MISGYASRRCSFVATSSATASLASAATMATVSESSAGCATIFSMTETSCAYVGAMSARTPGGRSAGERAVEQRRRELLQSGLRRGGDGVVLGLREEDDDRERLARLEARTDAPRRELPQRGGGPRLQHLAGDGRELLDRERRDHTPQHHTRGRRPMALAPAKNYSGPYGRLRFRSQRRARDDDRAARQPEVARRLQAPRSEPSHVLAAHRRQRRVRGLLPRRPGRRRDPAGARHAPDAEHPVSQLDRDELHGRATSSSRRSTS